jgi:hypothetical protein
MADAKFGDERDTPAGEPCPAAQIDLLVERVVRLIKEADLAQRH